MLKNLQKSWLGKFKKLSASVLLLAGLAGGSTYYLEVQERENYTYQGLPVSQTWYNWKTWHHVIRNEGFMVGYSELRMNPLWVTYRLEPQPDGPIGKRPSRFNDDKRSLVRVKHDDYTGSGYDRGHLAPNYAIAKVYGREAQLETFLMTNISPQTPNLNRKIWQRIEQSAMDHFAPLKREVWVTTGPVFGKAFEFLPNSFIQIPTAFYKIFVAPANNQRGIEVLAFLVPQDVQGNEPMSNFLVKVRDIEAQTGLNFLHRLSQEEQDKLETQVNSRPWQLEKVNTRAGRF